jgi:hypothetical protein
MLEADMDTCGRALDTDVESGVREHTFHLPLQTAAATENEHRRYILMIVSILYQSTGCKGTGVQQAERKQQGRAPLDVLFKPEFNIGLFLTKLTKVLFVLVKKRRKE